MNEFLEQFLIESRELIEQATADLLALEETPDDAERLGSAFRAFHTLKGAAGIVEFAAMGRALHAAEEVLSSVRAGAQPVTPDLVSNGLTCLDQVLQWLDVMEATGEPPADAEAAATGVVARFEAAVPGAVVQGDTGHGPETLAWVDRLLEGLPDQRARARVALRYAPDADCFFRGEDPIALVGRLPGLLGLRIEPARPWPALGEVDPFACNLVVAALTSAGQEEAAAHFRIVADQVSLHDLAGGASDLPPIARSALEEQVRVLQAGGAEDFVGRLGSVGRLAGALLRWLGRADAEAALEAAMARSREAARPEPLIAALQSLLAGETIAAEAPRPEVETVAPQGPQDTAARALRVDVERIDAIVSLAGELTVVKNAVGHAARLAQTGEDPAAVAAALKDQHLLLERLVGELQRSVLAIRVLPLRHVFQRFPRVLREIAAGLGKPARLITEGDATEADKAIVESLFEPLLHVLRNALDHGIEDPARRGALGKPEVATVRLRAFRQGEHVIVEVSDDGSGVDVARVREVAAARGVVDPEVLATMSDADAVDLIFAPGFSTAATVTDLSGRGVGMDAVRTAVERMGGRVAVSSAPGQGTTVRFTLPFTVMMTRVMTVEAGGQVFGVPFESVLETVRIARERIVSVGAGEAFVLRDRTIPVVGLASSLDLPTAARAPEAAIVVALAGGRMGGLEVDRFGERLDVMLKPMEGILAGTPGVAGTTLLGDGRVLIVLDLAELLQ